MGVDILPTELSVESSKHFGEALMPLLRQLISGGFSKDDDVYEKLPPELVSHCFALCIEQSCTHFYHSSSNMSRFVHYAQANACITQNGSLTPNFQYIEALMSRAQMAAAHHSAADPHLLLRIRVSFDLSMTFSLLIFI